MGNIREIKVTCQSLPEVKGLTQLLAHAISSKLTKRKIKLDILRPSPIKTD